MKQVSAQAVFSKAEEVLESKVGETTILMSTESGKFIELNGHGGAIWSLIDGTRDVAAVQAQLQDDYDVGAEECARDVSEFLAQLEEAELIRSA